MGINLLTKGQAKTTKTAVYGAFSLKKYPSPLARAGQTKTPPNAQHGTKIQKV
jgi:hypothetical protein